MTPVSAPRRPRSWCGSQPAERSRWRRRQRERPGRRRRPHFPAHCRVRVDQHAVTTAESAEGGLLPALDRAGGTLCTSQSDLSAHARCDLIFSNFSTYYSTINIVTCLRIFCHYRRSSTRFSTSK